MAKVGTWSTTAASNNSSPPDGWPEGQAPSTVNNCAREMMAAIRTVFDDAQFFDQNLTPTYISATSFSVAGDQTSAIHAGRRLKLFDGATIYATVTTASYTTVTTVDISIDSGSLTSSLSSFAIGIIAVTNTGLPPAALRGDISVSSIQAVNAGFSGAVSAASVNATVVSGFVVNAITLGVTGRGSASAFAVNGVLSVSSIVATGPATFGSTITASGTVTLLGNLEILGQLSATGARVANAFTASSIVATGPLKVGTTLSVSGASVMAGNLDVAGTFSVSGAAVVTGALSVGGAAVIASARVDGALSVSGTVVAANVPKAWAVVVCTAGGANLVRGFNVSTVSRTAVGQVKITFTTPFSTSSYCVMANSLSSLKVLEWDRTTSVFEYQQINSAGAATDAVNRAYFSFLE